MKRNLFILSLFLGFTLLSSAQNSSHFITDGDLRRAIQHHQEIMSLKAKDIMTCKPKTIHENTLAVDALQMMKNHQITNIFVVSEDDKYLGVIHIHDIIKEGIY